MSRWPTTLPAILRGNLSRGRSSLLALLATGCILLGLNLAAERWLAGVRLDLTQQGLYSLSPGTRAVLAGLREPVTLRLFASRALGDALPAFAAYSDRVQAMLRQYAQASGGRLRLEILDPEPFSATEDRAIAGGLQGVPLDRSGETVYFGLLGSNLLDDTRRIGFFQPARERFLEFDLTRIVYELSNPTRPVIGVMSTLPLDGDMAAMARGRPGAAPWVAMLQLHEAFDVRIVATDAAAIPAEIHTLLLVHPQGLSEATQYAVDQFVMRGGRLMAMVDPHSEAQAATPLPDGLPPVATGSDLARLFAAWGIGFDPSQVTGDRSGAWRVNGGAGERVQAVDYPPWFNIRDGISRDDPATADLEQVTVAAAGALTKKAGADVSFTPLLRSSAESAPIPVAEVAQPDPAAFLAGFRPAGGPLVIAARLRGVLHSAFAGPPVAGGPYRARTEGPADLVVVADTDLLDDRFWVKVQNFFGQPQATPFSDNGAFMVNVVGTLAGGDALLGLRGRGAALRPFEVIDALRRDAEARFRATEQRLKTHLAEADKHLADLRAGRGADGATPRAVLTVAQRALIDAASGDIADTRRQLRGVQLDLRREIDALEWRVRLFDIVLVPVSLVLASLAVSVWRARRRRVAV